MKMPRALVPVLLAAGLALAACGGSSSGGSSSAAASKASAIASAVSSAASQASTSSGASASSGGGAVSASDKAFCDTFSSAKDRFGTQAGLPTGEDIKKIQQFADDLEKTAPAEIKDDAGVLADYFRFIANVAGKNGLASAAADLQQEISKVQPAIIHVTTWSATHCNKS
jgi:hypothetical protein